MTRNSALVHNLMHGNTRVSFTNPRLKTHHIFDPRRIVSRVVGLPPRADAEGVKE